MNLNVTDIFVTGSGVAVVFENRPWASPEIQEVERQRLISGEEALWIAMKQASDEKENENGKR